MASKKGGLVLVGLGLAAAAGFALAGRRTGQQAPSSTNTAKTPGLVRQQIVAVAKSQLGLGNADKYWADVAPSLVGTSADWCGGFVLWALHQAGVALDKQWIVGQGFILTGQHPLPTTSSPQPGDIAYMAHLQHEAIVESVNLANDTVTLINGDGQGHVVSEDTTPISNITAFYSIAPYVSQALAA